MGFISQSSCKDMIVAPQILSLRFVGLGLEIANLQASPRLSDKSTEEKM